jgi:peptidylprolyl isomerase
MFLNLSTALAILLVMSVVAACAGGQPPMADTGASPAAPTEQAATEPAAPTAQPEAPAAESAAESAPDVAARDGMYDAPPPMTIDPSKYYYATLATDVGDIKVQLFADRAPETVNNFVYLAQEGFYDDTTFHRVLEGFMAQAGDPTGTGMGGPGYQFADEFYPGGSFDRPGLLAMANSGPNTNGSQFFLTFAPTPWLDNMHTIFGEVIEGQDVLNQIKRRDPEQNPAEPGTKLLSVTIEETAASVLPTPTPLPPTPTPFAPSGESSERPLAALPAAEKVNYFNTAPEMSIDTAKTYTATIATSKGDLTVALFDDVAPTAVNNFVVLADLGFFDGTPINNVDPTQIVVFGSPDNSPQSDAGYTISPEVGLPDAPAAGGIAYNSLAPNPDGGVIASSSQLLIAIAPPPAEAGASYSFFAQVVEGLDILPTLTTSDTVESVTIAVGD